MIELYQFPRAWSVPNPGPFCIKLESYLRLAGLNYEVRETVNFRAAPRGKIPYIRDDGELVGDSDLILRHLKRRYGDPLDGNLTLDQRARGHVISRMLSESTYFTLLYCRWIDDGGYGQVVPALFGGLPARLRPIIGWRARRQVRHQLHVQGIGRLEREQVYDLGCADVDALAGLLGTKPYFLGDLPSSTDAAAYALLVSFIGTPITNPVQERCLRAAKLMDFVNRMQGRCFPELPAL